MWLPFRSGLDLEHRSPGAASHQRLSFCPRSADIFLECLFISNSAVAFLNLPCDTRRTPIESYWRFRSASGFMFCTPFQKKLKKGIETPKRDVDLIKKRYIEAQELAHEYEKTKTN